MSTTNDTIVYIYVLQRLSDKAYLYIGSSKNPEKRFKGHRRKSPYQAIKSAFINNDIRFIVITQTDEAHRIEIEHALWQSFIEAKHPIVNIDPALTAHEYGKPPWNKGVPMSDEQKQKLSQIHTGKPRGSYSDEHKKNVSAAKMGHEVSAETRKKLSDNQKGKHLSDETKAKLSEIMKKVRATKKWR